VPAQLLEENLVAAKRRVIQPEMPAAIRTIAIVNGDGSRRISSALQNSGLKVAPHPHPADSDNESADSERVA
jgi:hypothetical protein